MEIVEGQAGPSTEPSEYVRIASDFKLMALAPDMARELLRLHQELTDLRDLMRTNAGSLKADGLRTAGDYSHNCAETLTRILLGDEA